MIEDFCDDDAGDDDDDDMAINYTRKCMFRVML